MGKYLQKLGQNINTVTRFEPYFFYLIIGLNLIPLLKFQFFPSLDGPAHLYNSQLIGSLWAGGFNTLQKYFIFNSEPVPNWSGHFMLALFNSFLPAWLAEKITLLFYLVALPLGFRALLNTQSPHNKAFSYLVFPFTYSSVFVLGFYNFSIAIAICLITVSFWNRHCRLAPAFKHLLLLFVLITVCYFSHIFVFLVLMGSIATLMALQGTYNMVANPAHWKVTLKQALKPVLMFVLCALPSLILCARYILQTPPDSEPLFVNNQKLKTWLFEMAPLICYDGKYEKQYSLMVLCLFGLLLLSTLLFQFHQMWRLKFGFQQLMLRVLNPRHTWLLLSLAMFFLYWVLPDFKSGAGLLSIRLLFLSYLMLALWLTVVCPHKYLSLVSIVVCLIHLRQTASYRKQQLHEMNKLACEYYHLGNKLEAESVVLTVNANSNWMFGHFSNYLGADKLLILLDNYECELDYFPVMWNMKNLPAVTLGTDLNFPLCVKWRTNAQNAERKIDYVFINGTLKNLPDSCSKSIQKIVVQHFSCIYQSPNCQLFKRRL